MKIEDIKNVVDYLVSMIPPGEYKHIVNDITVLMNNDVSLKPLIAESLKIYQSQQFTQVSVKGLKNKVLLTPYNGIPDSTRFFDPRNNKSFDVDVITLKTNDLRLENVKLYEPYQSLFQKNLEDYVETYYDSGEFLVVTSNINDKISVKICIESHIFNENNFQNARMRNQWNLCIDEFNFKAEITGETRVQTHYYESGNVQLLSIAKHKSCVSAGNAEDLVKVAVQNILLTETNYQKNVNESFHMMSEKMFKSLRRALPITKTLFDWSKVGTHKVNKELIK